MTESRYVSEFGEYAMEPWDQHETYFVRVLRCDKGPESFVVEKVTSQQSFDRIDAILKKLTLKAYNLHTKSFSSRPCIYCDPEFRYRAYILDFLPDENARLVCVDTLDYHTVAVRDLFELPVELLTVPVAVAEFQMADFDDSLRTKSIALKMRNIIENRFVKLTVAKKHSDRLPEVYLYHQNANVLDLLRTYANSGQTIPFYKTMALPSRGDRASIYVSYVCSAAQFFVQYNSCLDSINAMIDTIAVKSSKAFPLKESETGVDRVCLAYYRTDKNWHRGQIVRKTSPNEIHVQFIDYGNTEVVTLSCLKQIDSQLVTEWPQMAVQCSLNGMEQLAGAGGDQSNDLCNKIFSDLVLEKTFDMIVMDNDTKSNSLVVELRNERNVSVSEMLYKHRIALSASAISEPLTVAATTIPEQSNQNTTIDANRNFYQRKVQSKPSFTTTNNNNTDSLPLAESVPAIPTSINGIVQPASASETNWDDGNVQVISLKSVEITENDCVDAVPVGGDSGSKKPLWERMSDLKTAAAAAASSSAIAASGQSWQAKDDWDTNSAKTNVRSSHSYRTGGDCADDNSSTGGSRSTYGGAKRSNTSSVCQLDLIDQISYSSNMCEKIDLNERFNESPFANGHQLRVKVSSVKSLAEIECRLDDNDRLVLELFLSQAYKDETNRTAGLFDLPIEKLTDAVEAAPAALVVNHRSSYYRAYLNRKLSHETVSVYLYDCGYNIELPIRNCYPVISRKILQFPKQFLIGSLEMPENGRESQLIENESLRKYSGQRFFKCTILEHFEGFRYRISLKDQRDVSILQFFLDNSLVAYATPESHQPQLIFDPSFVLNRFFNVFVSHIDSFECCNNNKFPTLNSYYVYLDTYRAENVLKTIHESVVANGVGTKLTKLVVGQQVIIRDDKTGKYCRGEVRCVGPASELFLIDIGRTVKMPGDEIAAWALNDSKLLEIEPQAVCCSFDTDSGKCLSLDEFRAMTRKTFRTYVRHHDPVTNRLFLVFYNCATNESIHIEAVDFTIPDTDNSFGLYPYLKLGRFDGYVSSIIDFQNVYIQPDTITDRLNRLLNELYEFYEITGNSAHGLDDVYVNRAVACKSIDDGNWYRARIHCVCDEKITVQFVDYGNYETDVSPANLRVLDARFFDEPQLTIAGCLRRIDTVMLEFVKRQVTERKVEIVIDANGYVDIFIDNVDLLLLVLTNEKQTKLDGTLQSKVDELWSEEDGGMGSDDEKTKCSTNETMEPESTSVYITHINTINDFFVINAHDQDSLVDLVTELNSDRCVRQMKDFVDGRFELGRKCLVKYSQDQQWYRAEIIDCDPDIVTVRFIDYGNVEVLTIADGDSANIKEFESVGISGEMLQREPFARHCSLDCREINEASARALAMLRKFADRDDGLVLVDRGVDVNGGGRKRVVDLWACGEKQSIVERLIDEKLVFSKADSKLERRTGYVSHFESLDRFWIQFESSVDRLEAMAAALVDYERLPIVAIDRLTVGAVYAARFADDNLWYRARVVEILDGCRVLVHFIDYGNTAECETECRALSDELAVACEPLAKLCSLRKPGNARDKKWSAKANEQFRVLAGDGATVFVVKFDDRNDSHLVDLFLIDDLESDMETNVLNRLDLDADEIQMVAHNLQQIEGKISSFTNMDLFWFQSNDMIENLERLQSKLIGETKLVAGKIGTVFVNEYRKWCRCRITDESGELTHVHLIDYGPVIGAREIFELNDDHLCIIPPLTMQCTTKDERFAQINRQQVLKINIIKQNDGVCELELAEEPNGLLNETDSDTVENVLNGIVNCVLSDGASVENVDSITKPVLEMMETAVKPDEDTGSMETLQAASYSQVVVIDSVSKPDDNIVVEMLRLEPEPKNDLETQVPRNKSEKTGDLESQVVSDFKTMSEKESQVAIDDETNDDDFETGDGDTAPETNDLESILVDKLYQSFLNNSTDIQNTL